MQSDYHSVPTDPLLLLVYVLLVHFKIFRETGGDVHSAAAAKAGGRALPVPQPPRPPIQGPPEKAGW